MKILVPGDAAFDAVPELDDPTDVAIPYPLAGPLPEEHLDAEVLVIWSSPGELVAQAAEHLTALRWVQTIAAGADQALNAGFGPEVTITSGVGLHDETVAEHTLTLILASVRRLHRTMAAQHDHAWDSALMAAQTATGQEPHFTLSGARVTIWGFGSIAAQLAPYLQMLGAQVTGVARSGGERHGFKVIATDQLDELLPQTDILVSVLPGGPGTERALSAERLALLPAHAHFVNVGRGSTVDEQALVAALTERRLAGAAIDVAATEPLPADSPLWDAPNLIITPHVAGGRPQHVKAFLTAQVRAWKAGGPETLANVIPRR